MASLLLGAILGCLMLCSCREISVSDAYQTIPTKTAEIHLMAGRHAVEPLRMELVGDTLFVVARGIDRVLLYGADTFEHLGEIELKTVPTVSPSALAVTKDAVVIGDHARGQVAFFDREGTFRDAFGVLPDGETAISPMAITEFGGVLYVADVGSKRVLAVSMTDVENLTELGELILSIPLDTRPPLTFPSAVLVTPDGRLLVGDAGVGGVRVFTCDGRDIYNFDLPPEEIKAAPQAMAIDDVPDPSLQDEDSFDPSGVRGLGRVHLVDGVNGRIHMFNPFGRYISSYPNENQRLAGPSDIAIDPARKRIIVCDSSARCLVIFSYGGTT